MTLEELVQDFSKISEAPNTLVDELVRWLDEQATQCPQESQRETFLDLRYRALALLFDRDLSPKN